MSLDKSVNRVSANEECFKFLYCILICSDHWDNLHIISLESVTDVLNRDTDLYFDPG